MSRSAKSPGGEEIGLVLPGGLTPAGHTDKKNIADKKKVQVECLDLFQHVHHVFYDYDYVVG